VAGREHGLMDTANEIISATNALQQQQQHRLFLAYVLLLLSLLDAGSSVTAACR